MLVPMLGRHSSYSSYYFCNVVDTVPMTVYGCMTKGVWIAASTSALFTTEPTELEGVLEKSTALNL